MKNILYLFAFICGFMFAVLLSRDEKHAPKAIPVETTWAHVNGNTGQTNQIVLWFSDDGKIHWNAGTNGVRVTE